MPNITLSIDEKLLKKGREYARRHQISLNSLIRQLLEETVLEQHENQLEACFQLMDQVHASSKGRKWKREELYER